MVTKLVQIERGDEGIAVVTLNRPNKRNALNIPLLEQLAAAVEQLNEDSCIRVIILGGMGAIFCAGLDLSEANDPSKVKTSSELLARVFTLLHESPHVTIAAVHGAAVAGGAGLMLACDLAIAAEKTKFGFPETQKGLIAAQVLTFLTRQLKQRDIKELLLLGELIDAKKALHIGMINSIVPIPNLIHEAVNMAHKAMRGAPRATSQTKELIDTLYPVDFEEDLRLALEFHEKARSSDEAKEGITSFLENRPPIWNTNRNE